MRRVAARRQRRGNPALSASARPWTRSSAAPQADLARPVAGIAAGVGTVTFCAASVGAILFCAVALLVASPSARAEVSTDPGVVAAAAAEPWIGRQRPNGSFVDYLPTRRGGDRYGTAMMGLALLDQGIRLGSQPRIDAGLKAMRFASRRAFHYATHRHGYARRVVFDNFAVAAAYNLARTSLAGDPRFESMAPKWRRTLRAMRRRVLGNHGYYNYKLVHAVAILELLNSGLRSHRRGSVLAGRRRARAYVRQVINHDITRVARFYDRERGTKRTTTISDPPWNPPAYQAFSLMLVARAAELMNGADSRSARAALMASMRGMARLMGPDGDVSYFGRSQEQSWTLAGVVYAASAVQPYADPALRQTAKAMAVRALARLQTDYWRPDVGLAMTPSFVQSTGKPPLRGVDTYAGGSSYAALTMVPLEWAAHEAAISDGAGAPIPADAQSINFVGRGQSTVATVRAGDRWFAVSRAPARISGSNSLYARDLRYDAGLVAFKAPDASGRWIDVMPLRPRTGTPDSAGPTLRRFGRLWRPVGSRIDASPRGTITLDGELRDFKGNPAHRRLRMIIAPEGCGVRVSFGVHAGERTQFSAFFRRVPDRRKRKSLVLSDDHQNVYVTPVPNAVKLQGGYSSAADAGLVRARMTFKSNRTRRVSVTICVRG